MVDPFVLDFLGIGYAHNFWHRLIWTGDAYAPDNIYSEALNASADHLRKCSPIRGAYIGAAWDKKIKGKSQGGNLGVEGSWAIEEGFGLSGQLGAGYQKGYNTPTYGTGFQNTKMFTSQQAGLSAGFGWNQQDGFNFSYDTYASHGNRYGGANIGGNSETWRLGFGYGKIGVGFIIDPKRLKNLLNNSDCECEE